MNNNLHETNRGFPMCNLVALLIVLVLVAAPVAVSEGSQLIDNRRI
jgi:hypothetical protein